MDGGADPVPLGMTDPSVSARSTERADSLPAGAVELGIHSFGDVTDDPTTGAPVPQPQVLREILEEIRRTDEVGLDVYGMGEHHRPDFAVSAPELVLAAAAPLTSRVKLASAVTVLSSDDPVRVYQRFAHVDALSGGRAEVSLGRGSFTESYALFGYDLKDYDRLFEEKFDLFLRLRREEPVTWHGTVRPPLREQAVFPVTEHPDGLPVWRAVGGSPQSVVGAARAGAGLELAVIGGPVRRFAPFADLFRRSLEEFGVDERRVALHSPGLVAATDDEALERMWPHWERNRAKIGAERGWPPPTKDQYLHEVRHGALHVGAPETVARKVADSLRTLGATRFSLKLRGGGLSHPHMLETIELFGTQVARRVREMLAEG